MEAVNTVVFTEDGRRVGDNTDIPGMVAALRERGVDKVESAAVLGAGATASSALAALAVVCAGPVTAYVRSSRAGRRDARLGERLGVDVITADWADGAAALNAPLVIATTPAGATDAFTGSVPEAPGILFDVLYEPWPTRLAAAWSAHGGAVVGGLDLLVHQALLQVEQMTGRIPAPLARHAACRGSRARLPLIAPSRASPVRLLDRRPDRASVRGRIGGGGPGPRTRWRRWISGASMRSTVEQVALADRGESHGPALVATLEGLPPVSRSPRRWSRRRWPGDGSATAAARG